MDFNLKQRRYQQHESDLKQPYAKLARLLLDPQQQGLEQPQPPSGSPALPLFVPELTSCKLSDLSAFPADSTTTATRFPKMGSFFSLGQWQELELQALIFRYMVAGAAVPTELLHFVKKSLLHSSPPPPPPPPPYYLHHPVQNYSHYHPALLQSGYWGRASMDPEPGRCRRTDGKKWRCARDVVAGQKYCERHVHRGRNRSRKPVEIPTSSSAGGSGGGASGGGGFLKTSSALAAQHLVGGTHFDLSGPSPSVDLFHLNQRPSESRTENKGLSETQNEVAGDDKSGTRVLRRFFDDWPRSLQECDNAGSNAGPVISSTCLSISTPGNTSSDFSLKLSTGDELGLRGGGSVERERLQLNWAGGGGGGGLGTNQMAPMGGPLGEALRSSSTCTSSPKSVLHQLPPGSASETSYVSTST